MSEDSPPDERAKPSGRAADHITRLSAIGAVLAERMPSVLEAAIALLESIPPALEPSRPERYQITRPIGAWRLGRRPPGQRPGARASDFEPIERMIGGMLRRRPLADRGCSRGRAWRLVLVRDPTQATRIARPAPAAMSRIPWLTTEPDCRL